MNMAETRFFRAIAGYRTADHKVIKIKVVLLLN